MTDVAKVLECIDLEKSYSEGGNALNVLKGVNFVARQGERISIVGASGSGKSTLLHLLGGLDVPTRGSIRLMDKDITELSESERGLHRNRSVGFVYQFHHLLPEFTALENVSMPLLIRKMPINEVKAQATELLSRVGLSERLTHKPGELSGGERQRAAVARALITRPAVVLADEPTGNLDGKTGDQVFQLMLELNVEFGTSLIVVTHDIHLAAQMDRTLTLEDGTLQ